MMLEDLLKLKYAKATHFQNAALAYSAMRSDDVRRNKELQEGLDVSIAGSWRALQEIEDLMKYGPDQFKHPLMTLELPIEIHRNLRECGIDTVGGLLKLSLRQVGNLSSFSLSDVNQIEKQLTLHGLRLAY